MENNQLDNLNPFRPVQKIQFRQPSSSRGIQKPLKDSSQFMETRDRSSNLTVGAAAAAAGSRTDTSLPRLISSDKQEGQFISGGVSSVNGLGSSGWNLANRKPSSNIVGYGQQSNEQYTFTQDISQLYVDKKIRDLQMLILQIQSSTERKISKIYQQNPKLFSNMREIENNQGEKLNSYNERLLLLNQNFHHLQNMILKQNNQIDSTQHSLNAKLSLFENQIQHLEAGKDSNVFGQYNNNLLAIESPDLHSLKAPSQLENQMQFFKQNVQQELLSKENTINDLQRQLKDIGERMIKQEKEMINKFDQFQESLNMENRSSTAHTQERDKVKLERILNEFEQLRANYSQIQKKYEEESERREKQEKEERMALQKKVNFIREEIKNDERTILSGEQSLAEHFVNSINSLKELIKVNKDEVQSSLHATQTLFGQNLKSLSGTIDLVRAAMMLRISELEKSQIDMANRVQLNKDQISDHFNHLNTEMAIHSDNIKVFQLESDKKLKNSMDNFNSTILRFQKENQGEYENFQRKNLAVFTEVSNALKGLKGEITQERQETFQRLKDFREELNNFQTVNEGMLQNLDEHTKHMDKQIEFQINENRTEILALLNNEVEQFKRTLQTNNQTLMESAQIQIETEISKQDQDFQAQINTALTDHNSVQKQFINDSLSGLEEKLNSETAQNSETLMLLKKEFQRQQEEVRQNQEQNDKKITDFTYQLNDSLRDIRGEVLTDIGQLQARFQIQLQQQLDLSEKRLDKEIKESDKKLKKLMQDQSLQQAQEQVIDTRDMHQYVQDQINQSFRNQCLVEVAKERSSRLANQAKTVAETQNMKNMLLEAVHQKSETVKAVARALINEESSQRMAFLEELSKSLNSNINNLDKSLRSLVATENEAIKMELQTNLNLFDKNIRQFKLETMKKLENFDEVLQKTKNQFEAQFFATDLRSKIIFADMQELQTDIETQKISSDIQREQDAVLTEALREAIEQTCDNIQQLEIDMNQTKINLNTVVDKNDQLFQLSTELRNDLELNQEEISNINKGMDKLNESTSELDQQFTKFVQKTSNNFRSTQQIIQAHSQFMNKADSQLYLDSIKYEYFIASLQEEIQNLQNIILNGDAQIDDQLNIFSGQIENLKCESDEKFQDVNQEISLLVPLKEEIQQLESGFKSDLSKMKEENVQEIMQCKQETEINLSAYQTQSSNQIKEDFSKLKQESSQQIEQVKKQISSLEEMQKQISSLEEMQKEIQINSNKLKELENSDDQEEFQQIKTFQQQDAENITLLKTEVQILKDQLQKETFKEIDDKQKQMEERLSDLKIQIDDLSQKLNEQN